MAHAFVAHVALEGRTAEEGQRLLNERIVPAVKQHPGFQRGLWLRSRDGSTGMGIIVFDTEENAQAWRDGMAAVRPAEAPPITGSEIFEVSVQA